MISANMVGISVKKTSATLCANPYLRSLLSRGNVISSNMVGIYVKKTCYTMCKPISVITIELWKCDFCQYGRYICEKDFCYTMCKTHICDHY